MANIYDKNELVTNQNIGYESAEEVTRGKTRLADK